MKIIHDNGYGCTVHCCVWWCCQRSNARWLVVTDFQTKSCAVPFRSFAKTRSNRFSVSATYVTCVLQGTTFSLITCTCSFPSTDRQICLETLKLPFSSEANRIRAQRIAALNLSVSDHAFARAVPRPQDWTSDILALWKGVCVAWLQVACCIPPLLTPFSLCLCCAGDEGIQKAFAQSQVHDMNVPDSGLFVLRFGVALGLCFD